MCVCVCVWTGGGGGKIMITFQQCPLFMLACSLAPAIPVHHLCFCFRQGDGDDLYALVESMRAEHAQELEAIKAAHGKRVAALQNFMEGEREKAVAAAVAGFKSQSRMPLKQPAVDTAAIEELRRAHQKVVVG